MVGNENVLMMMFIMGAVIFSIPFVALIMVALTEEKVGEE
jgi:hypothetical protein